MLVGTKGISGRYIVRCGYVEYLYGFNLLQYAS